MNPKPMGPVAFVVCGVFLVSLSTGLGIALGISIARQEADREIRRLRLKVDSMKTELNDWRRRQWS